MPDLPQNEWIRAVRKALRLSEPLFAQAIGTTRDTLTKWVAKEPREVGFVHTRRIVTIAPPELVLPFIGQHSALALRPGLDPTTVAHVQRSGGTEDDRTMITDAEYIAGQLNAIDDDLVRRVAAARCTEAIAQVLREARDRRPQAPGAK